MSASARFRGANRLVSPRDYARIRRSGRRIGSRNFVVSVAERSIGRENSTAHSSLDQLTHSRLGLTVSRKVGNAVVRNRVKRAVREWFRVSRERVMKNVDVVVIARRGAADRGVAEIAQELNSLLAESSAAVERKVRK